MKAYVAFGSNENQETNIEKALDLIGQLYPIVKVSSFYESEAIGETAGEAAYLNGVLIVETNDDAFQIRAQLKAIESSLGRDVKNRKRVPIDLDLILLDDLILESESLLLPSPDIEKYDFIQIPLAEIAGEVRHPLSQKLFKTYTNK